MMLVSLTSFKFQTIPNTNVLLFFLFSYFPLLQANGKIARHKKIEEKMFCLEMNPGILQQDVQLWRLLLKNQVGKARTPNGSSHSLTSNSQW